MDGAHVGPCPAEYPGLAPGASGRDLISGLHLLFPHIDLGRCNNCLDTHAGTSNPGCGAVSTIYFAMRYYTDNAFNKLEMGTRERTSKYATPIIGPFSHSSSRILRLHVSPWCISKARLSLGKRKNERKNGQKESLRAPTCTLQRPGRIITSFSKLAFNRMHVPPRSLHAS